MDTQEVKSTASKPSRRFRPFGFLYGGTVGAIVASAWSSTTGNPAIIATTAAIGAIAGAFGGHFLTSRLKPNRTMING